MCIEVILPAPAVISTIEFLNYGSHLGVVSHLALAILFHSIYIKTSHMTAEDPRNKIGCTNLLLVELFCLKHAPFSLNNVGGTPFSFPTPLSFYQHGIVGIYYILVPLLLFTLVFCHLLQFFVRKTLINSSLFKI